MVNKVENIITVINYIENNLTEKLNLSSIAMGVGYSKYHSTSPSQYRNLYKNLAVTPKE